MHQVKFSQIGWNILNAKLKTPTGAVWLIYDGGLPKHMLQYAYAQCAKLKSAHHLAIETVELKKTISESQKIWRLWLANGVQRDACIIVMGGGALTDFIGFTAALYKRGIPCIYIPTTLVGMVDAAIGGKTAVNFCGIKNSIGVLAPPKVVVIDLFFLKSLPKNHYHQGWVELCKTALIHSEQLWKTTLRIGQPTPNLIQRIIRCKLLLTSIDPNDTGPRQHLNYGHTIGHALEAWSHQHKKPIAHGAAVCWGILVENEIAVRLKLLSPKHQTQISNALMPYAPKLFRPLPKAESLLKFLRHDKKNAAQHIRMTLIKAPGKPLTGYPVSEKLITDVLKQVCHALR
ncbi:MAG: 3-dehydroquinate synthase [Bacteroidia bacterium]|jgi:3-dehydroquinate synthase